MHLHAAAYHDEYRYIYCRSAYRIFLFCKYRQDKMKQVGISNVIWNKVPKQNIKRQRNSSR